MAMNLDAILRPVYEKYREYFASEEVLDTHHTYEPGKLSYFVSSTSLSHLKTNPTTDAIKIWNPVAPLPIQIEQEMKETIIKSLKF